MTHGHGHGGHGHTTNPRVDVPSAPYPGGYPTPATPGLTTTPGLTNGATTTQEVQDMNAPFRASDTALLTDVPPPPVPDDAKATRRGPVRDRYFDLLRAIALFRVVLYHLMGWAWLPVVFPSMGVMFALAGNLMARSLKRPPLQVVRSRMRRLLPPLWLLGAIGVTGMLIQGWGPDSEGHPAWWWLHLTYWVLPLSDPPYAEGLSGIHGIIGDDWAAELAGPLWYIRAYLWYVLLSPFILKLLRAVPWPTIVSPIAVAAALEFGWLHIPSVRIDSAVTDFSTFGACWILGMAHQEGILQRLPRYIVPSVVPFVAGYGLWYALTHGFKEGHDLDDLPFAQSLWSFATVMLLLHFSPSWPEWPRVLRHWDRLVTLLNSRAVTIYLWHNICILIAATLWDQLWGFDVLSEHYAGLLESPWPVLLMVWILIGACVVAFGWMEDVAAKRKPRLWPDGSESKRPKAKTTTNAKPKAGAGTHRA